MRMGLWLACKVGLFRGQCPDRSQFLQPLHGLQRFRRGPCRPVRVRRVPRWRACAVLRS